MLFSQLEQSSPAVLESLVNCSEKFGSGQQSKHGGNEQKQSERPGIGLFFSFFFLFFISLLLAAEDGLGN